MSRTRAYVGMYGSLILLNVTSNFWAQLGFVFLAVAHLWSLHKAEEE